MDTSAIRPIIFFMDTSAILKVVVTPLRDPSQQLGGALSVLDRLLHGY